MNKYKGYKVWYKEWHNDSEYGGKRAIKNKTFVADVGGISRLKLWVKNKDVLSIEPFTLETFPCVSIEDL